MEIRFETEYSAEAAELIEKVFAFAAKKFALPLKTEVIVSFLTSDEIREVNKTSRGRDETTDVLSFPYLDGIKGKKVKVSEHKEDVNPFTKCLMLGEINICLERAALQAKEYGHSYERECAYLALHGLLHVLGYDHMTDPDKLEMRGLEEEILSGLNINK